MHHSALFATPRTDVLKSADLQCAQEEAFVRVFTAICCERFRRAGGRSLALWDKQPFVFNQSPSSNEGKKMFQMTRVEWKGGLGGRGAFRNQIRPQKHWSAVGSERKERKRAYFSQSTVFFCPNATFSSPAHGSLKSLRGLPLAAPTWASVRMLWWYVIELKSNAFDPVFATCDLTLARWIYKSGGDI